MPAMTAFVVLLKDLDDARGLARVLRDTSKPGAEGKFVVLVPPIRGKEYFLRHSAPLLVQWRAEHLPKKADFVYLVNDEVGLSAAIKDQPGTFYRGAQKLDQGDTCADQSSEIEALAASTACAPATLAVTAAMAADQLRRAAVAAEAAVTPDLQDVITRLGAELPGLNFRFKSLPSLRRKLLLHASELAYRSASYGDGSLNKLITDATREIPDALRYTITFAPKIFWSQVTAASELLRARGYSQGKRRDYWERGALYKGLNTTFANPNDYLFELQFHTFESYFMNQKTHPAYERLRSMGTSPDERYAIEDRLAVQTEYLKWPIGGGGELARISRPDDCRSPTRQFFGSFLNDPRFVRELFALVHVPWRPTPTFLLFDRASGRWHERADMLQRLYGVNREQCRELTEVETAQLAATWGANLFTDADLLVLLSGTGS
jgi:hypothetical protein